MWFVFFWGAFVGFNELEVNHIEYVSEDLPEKFDGYRIVQFSDAHVGSYMKHNVWVLQRAVDSINAQKPDLIVFTGDLQNIQPSELYPHRDVLSSLKATDGIFSVLGNHDYADYLGCDEAIKAANIKEMISLQQQMGWTVLCNEHRTIEHDGQHIIIAGMENDGNGKNFPQRGDIAKTLEGVAKDDFILMLEHDPFSWRHRILPESDAQLTLSGHTHNVFHRKHSNDFSEHNEGAICATWWWTGKQTPGIHVSQDGTPGGFAVWEFKGKEFKHYFQSAGHDQDYQFRAYDMNEIKKVVTLDAAGGNKNFSTFVTDISSYPDNTILVNVWDFDDSWTVSISENGKELSVTKDYAYDPLHIMAWTAPRSKSVDSPNFTTAKWSHFFKATASSPTSTVTVKVTDRNGKVYTETMTRPKAFNINEYKNK